MDVLDNATVCRSSAIETSVSVVKATHEWLMRFGRFVLAPPHADWGYECREILLIVFNAALPMFWIRVWVFHDKYTAPWIMLPSCKIFVGDRESLKTQDFKNISCLLRAPWR